MASWQLIEYAGNTLKKVLEERLAALSLSPVDVRVATVANFSSLGNVGTPTISLFLYRVSENPDMRNGAMRHRPDGSIMRQPLALELGYMITTWGVRVASDPLTDEAAALEEHRLLGVVLQAFYDHAELGRSDLVDDSSAPVWSAIDSMQVVLDSLPVEDQYRIWDSGESAYRLSLTYRVRVLGLDPGEVSAGGRVLDANFTAGNL